MEKVEDVIQKKIKELFNSRKFEGKRIFVFGCNAFTKCINMALYDVGCELYGVLDNDKKKQGKRIANILIYDPVKVNWENRDLVLIASQHRENMINQILQLSDQVDVFILADIEKTVDKKTEKEKFWLEENYELEVQNLYQGAEIYDRLKENERMIVFSIPALGDIFVGGLYLNEYKKKIEFENVKIVIASQGAYRVTQLFNMKNVIVISKCEMELLVKFMFFSGMDNNIICSWIPLLCTMALYKKIVFPKYWAKYFFKLEENYQLNFPSIWDEKLNDKDLIKVGLNKGKSVIIAPYANSVQELPLRFWDLLVKRLIEIGYYVFTNIMGGQRPIKGSKGLVIPLNQIGNYLEFAGYFISIRSGLCEVAGQARCKQIILFRDESDDGMPEVEHYNLHSEDLSPNAFQYVYDDENLIKNVNMVIKCIINS